MPQYPGHEHPPPTGRRTSQRGARRRGLVRTSARRAAAARLVALAQLERDHLVVDLGAGHGALTTPLASAADRVVAVERDRALARALVRLADDDRVQIVEGDLLDVPLAGEPFTVVANLPYAVGTKTVRRLLFDGAWAARSGACPAARGGPANSGRATWRPLRRELGAVVHQRAFRDAAGDSVPPGATVDAGILRITARRPTLLSPAAFADHVSVIDVAFQTGRGQAVAQRLGPLAGRPTVARSLLTAAGIDPSATPSELRPEAWRP